MILIFDLDQIFHDLLQLWTGPTCPTRDPLTSLPPPPMMPPRPNGECGSSPAGRGRRLIQRTKDAEFAACQRGKFKWYMVTWCPRVLLRQSYLKAKCLAKNIRLRLQKYFLVQPQKNVASTLLIA